MITVRRALPADAERIAAAEAKYIDCPWTLAQIKSEIDSENAIFLVAECDGEFVGYLSGSIAADECEIANIAVELEHRRKGIGRALFNRFTAELAAYNVKSVFLLVRRGNTAAQALYGSLGFVEVGVRRGYYGKLDAVIMRLEI